MRTIFDSARPVKTTRKPFGVGLTRSLPRRERFTPSPADLAWTSQALNANTRTYEVIGQADSILDQRAGESGTLDALEAGYPPF